MGSRYFHQVFTGLLFGATLTSTLFGQAKPTLTAPVAATEPVSFEVLIPQQHRAELNALLEDLNNAASPNYHHWLKPAEVQARFGTDPAKVAAIQKELSNYGLTSTLTSPHILRVSGTAAAAQSALATTLFHGVNAKGNPVLVASQQLSAPASLAAVGAVVSDLSGVVRMHHTTQKQALPDNRYSTAGPYWFTDLKQAYDWPGYGVLTGTGTTIAVLVDGSYRQADMDLYFNHEALASPSFSEVLVDGGSPFNLVNGTGEAELDMQQSGGMAPNAKIILYSIPDLSDQSIVDGLAQIITDNKADVVNMSFGGSELAYTPVYNDGANFTSTLRFEDDLFAEGNAQGITFVAASGDQGALNVPAPDCFFTTNNPCGTFLASADFPASSPHVTGVGGTNLQTTYSPGSLRSAYVSEDAYANPLTEDIFYGTYATGGYWGSGGGNSVIFAKPSYQTLVSTGSNKRTVPDLALHMGGCPGGAICTGQESADVEALNGNFYLVIGTSAAAPDFAGLTALNIERFGTRLGNENPYIYTLAAAQKSGALGYKVFHQGIPGYNGFYSSGNEGYNRVLGNGTLYGKDFLLAPTVPSAGDPGTPSNP